MRMTESKVNTINERINNEIYKNPLDMRVSDMSIITGNLCVCDYNELSKMIQDLTTIKKIIEEETGVIC